MDVSFLKLLFQDTMLHDHYEIARNDDIKRLYVAALLGNAGDLTQLLNENIDLLEDVLLTRADTPLHITARFGHLNFVRTVLIHKPSLAWELDQDGFSAMNLASENGHITVVKGLLACDPLPYKLKDRDGRTLLHCAVIHERLEILHELLTNFVDCVGQVTVRRDGSSFGFEEQRLLYWKDKSGNTVLNLVQYIQEHYKERKLLQPGTDDHHQVQQKHEMLIAAMESGNFPPWIFMDTTNMLTGQKQLRLDQESMLFHLRVMFNLFGVVSAAYVTKLVLTGIEIWET